jgi:peroxiredoxin
VDDGACDHLKGIKFPSVSLQSTAGNNVDPASLSGLSILFCYPRTGAPGEVVPDEWNAIPGARGCTPQACSFRDASKEFLELGVSHIFGVSTQDTPYQQELKERVHLPYQLLSDEKLELVKALKLPTFDWKGSSVIKRLTLAVEDGQIVQIWYPVFPSDKNAGEVLDWLKSRTGRENLSTHQESDMMRNMQKKG